MSGAGPSRKVSAPTAAEPTNGTSSTALGSISSKRMQHAGGQVVAGFALMMICVFAFSVRLFSVVKYESVIHEFDPYFNYRVTQFLTKEGFYNLWNWFDDKTWYPLGRVIGGTVYPGLIYTAGVMYNLLHYFNIPIHVQEVCVFTAPLFSAFCSLAAYLFVKEVRNQGAGLIAAAFMGMVPSYISRSVAGSFDNEGVAIFALVFTFYLYVKTLNTGSLAWATALCLSYYYMVASWGGYTFIINLLPIHCLACIFLGRLSSRLYVAYAPLIIIGTIEAASIPVVGFNAVLMSEHFGAFLAFLVLHAALAIRYIKWILPARAFHAAQVLVISAGGVILAGLATLLVGYVMASPTFGWTGRSLSLLDPTYASKFIPIIASVSEHQPPSWPSYFTDLHILTLLMPFGLIACFRPLTDASLFLMLYGVTAVYFSGVMVRLMLVLAPAACCLAALAAHEVLATACRAIKSDAPEEEAADAAPASKKGKPLKASSRRGTADTIAAAARAGAYHPLPRDVGYVMLAGLTAALCFYAFHCTWVSAEMYSAPSIVLQSRNRDGSVHVFDDFREGYAWLRHNTEPTDVVASWWDYGYQTTAMANRTVVVDNNTWNNTHIATVGRAMASPERKAWRIFRELDVKYVFVVFGGFIGYPSDDINKFLWMVRIGGGVYPEIKEKDYLGQGNYRIDAQASKTMLESTMYKLSYYRFGEAAGALLGHPNFDRVRNTEIGVTDVKLKYFEEAFTTEHWMTRIYRVLDEPVREARPKSSSKGRRTVRRTRKKSSG